MPHQLGIPFAHHSHTSWKAATELRQSGTRGEKQRRLLRAYHEAYERAAAHARTNDFERTYGRDWT